MAVLFNISVLFFVLRITRPGECANRQAVFHRKKETYLANHVFKTKQAKTELQCGMHCVADGLCASVNYKTSGIGKGLCELNKKKLQLMSNDDENLYNREYSHLSIIKEQPPISCKDILNKSLQAKSGLYKISVNDQMVTVYCDMVLYGGGFTFIPKSAVKNGTLPNLVPQLFTSKSEVLLYIQKKDGSQTFTHIQQLKEEPQTPLVVLQNTNEALTTTYSKPENSFMGDYLYLSTSIHTNGFLSNDIEVKYNNSNFPIISYFAFFPNRGNKTPSTYHDSSYYETHGVAVNWRNTGKVSTERIPANFFYLTEVHYSERGCYTSSNRWYKANGTAIGLR